MLCRRRSAGIQPALTPALGHSSEACPFAAPKPALVSPTKPREQQPTKASAMPLFLALHSVQGVPSATVSLIWSLVGCRQALVRPGHPKRGTAAAPAGAVRRDPAARPHLQPESAGGAQVPAGERGLSFKPTGAGSPALAVGRARFVVLVVCCWRGRHEQARWPRQSDLVQRQRARHSPPPPTVLPAVLSLLWSPNNRAPFPGLLPYRPWPARAHLAAAGAVVGRQEREPVGRARQRVPAGLAGGGD